MTGIVITITSKVSISGNNKYNYQYGDRILKNIEKEEYEVFYSGQNQGMMDHLLINAVNTNKNFKVYYRQSNNSSFIYLGMTNISRIIQDRKKPIGRSNNTNINERLQIHLLIKNIDNEPVKSNNFTGSGRYKKDIFVHSNISINNNTQIGFYEY